LSKFGGMEVSEAKKAAWAPGWDRVFTFCWMCRASVEISHGSWGEPGEIRTPDHLV